MSTSGVDIEFKFPDWAGKLKRHADALNRLQAAVIQTNRGMIFDSEGSYNGRPAWAPLKFRSGQVLSRRGTLRKSIAPRNSRGVAGQDGIVRFEADAIVVGTRLAYARMMNNGSVGLPGGVLRAKNAKALRIPIPSGEDANDNARDVRAAPITKRLNEASAKLTKARARREKSRKRFEKTGSDAALKAAIGSERTLLRLSETVAKLRARAGKIHQTGKGGQGFIFRKWVRIPARRFDDWNAQDQREMDAALMAKITEILNK
jgi:phage gpG-like protein